MDSKKLAEECVWIVGPTSPCTKLCKLGKDGICLGCYRTLDEITHWGGMSAAEQRLTLQNCADRRRPIAEP